MTTSTTLHIVNHTHWDREWFLTSEYTSRWIPALVDRIEQITAQNPHFRYLLDGQTLVIEDLLAIAPDYEERVRALIASGQLQIGPYYCQPDWRLSCGELLIRNLLYGQEDMRRLGAPSQATGWLVDTFGHIAQAPQIHRLFAIDGVFVWRGVPRLEPYFTWRGSDGSALLAINLFGGYRNLYGVTHAPELALRRLHAEIQKLQPFYPTSDLPLFDGYDLEDNPEDPVRFYTEHFGADLQDHSPELRLQESTPTQFVSAIASRDLSLPTLRGELNSGKYGAIFPGTLSARTYLKIMAHDCERLLFHRVEPLAALAHLHGRAVDEGIYERWSRRLLQNAVHDCICGVSIDLVHEKMEDSYRTLFDEMSADLNNSLQTIMSTFESGVYAVSTNPFISEDWLAVGDALWCARAEGVGVFPIAPQSSLVDASEPRQYFSWQNDHYQAQIDENGALHLGANDLGPLGTFVVSSERGDTYSTEPGELLGRLERQSPLTVVQQSDYHAILHFSAAWHGDEASITANVRLWFDPSPLIRWQIDLDSRGTDLRVDMAFAAGVKDEVLAGMPFDLTTRDLVDQDLLPREPPLALSKVLLGQRELNAVHDFPMHDVVACALDNGDTLAIFARGLRAYRTEADGQIRLPLRRAVQWLTASQLQDRVGDAGPFFYVPGARCEREVRHEVALAVGPFAPHSLTLQKLNAAYQNPPLLVHVQDGGARQHWHFLQEDVPLSNLSLRHDAIQTRFYNPLPGPRPFSRPYRRSDMWGNAVGEVSHIAPHELLTVSLPANRAWHPAADRATIRVLTPPRWRVGPAHSRPDTAILRRLQETVAALDEQIAAVRASQVHASGSRRYHLQHRGYVLEREKLEHRLSLALNRRRLAAAEPLDPAYLYTPDPEIAAIGQALNHLRIKRRIFDYVVQAIEPEKTSDS